MRLKDYATAVLIALGAGVVAALLAVIVAKFVLAAALGISGGLR